MKDSRDYYRESRAWFRHGIFVACAVTLIFLGLIFAFGWQSSVYVMSLGFMAAALIPLSLCLRVGYRNWRSANKHMYKMAMVYQNGIHIFFVIPIYLVFCLSAACFLAFLTKQDFWLTHALDKVLNLTSSATLMGITGMVLLIAFLSYKTQDNRIKEMENWIDSKTKFNDKNMGNIDIKVQECTLVQTGNVFIISIVVLLLSTLVCAILGVFPAYTFIKIAPPILCTGIALVSFLGFLMFQKTLYSYQRYCRRYKVQKYMGRFLTALQN